MAEQELHCWEILTETDWVVETVNIDSEDDDLTDDLFHAVQKAVRFESKIISITRIN